MGYLIVLALPPAQPNPVIGCIGEVLSGAQVPFGGGDGGVAEQDLDLFEFAAGGAAEFGAGAADLYDQNN
jgi:hypothetical protein